MTLNVNNSVIINEALGHRTHHSCKPVINKTTGDIYASATDAAEQLNTSLEMVSRCCRGVIGSCKGNKLEYLDRTSGNAGSLSTELKRKNAEIEKLKAQIASMQADADVGRTIREAEENRIKTIENAKLVLKKANNKLDRRQRMVERKESEYMAAIDRYNEAVKEQHEAELRLLEAEGKVKA